MNIAEKILRAKADYDAVFEAGKKAVGEVLKFTDVASTTYRIKVPNNVEPFARVNKIGGMSYKTRQLLRFPYDETTVTRNGITFTSNADGSVTLNGTNNGAGHSSFHFSKITNPIRLSAGTYVGSTGNSNVNMNGYDGTTYYSFTSEVNKFATSVDLNIYIQVNKGNSTTFNNVVIYPMLNEGTTALPYEPFFEGLRNASVSELKSAGANQFDINAEPLELYNTKITRLEDGLELKTAVAITSTASNFYYRSNLISIKGSKAYFRVNATPVGKVTEGLARIWVKDENGNNISSIQKRFAGDYVVGFDVPQNLLNKGYLQILLYASAGEICDAGDGVIYNKPMLSFDANVPYTKYKGNIDTLSVPEPIKSLDGYGLGVNAEYYNYIDFERKVFVQRVKAVDMGRLSWSYRFSKDRHMFATSALKGDIQGQIGSTIPINALSADYRAVTVNSTWVDRDMAYNSSKVGNTTVEFVDNRYTDADTFKNAVNGKILVYALAEPIETDISAYLTDEYIEVEGGGTITAVNEYGYDAPTNISYLIDTQGG